MPQADLISSRFLHPRRWLDLAEPVRLLPVGASALFAASVAAVVLASLSAQTLGHDYLAYDAAARRLLAGRPLYDTSFEAAGGFGLYYYPPPFAVALLPLVAVAPADVAVWLWTSGLVAALLVGIALLPVRPTVRWLVLGLAGLTWPAVYSIKLGQVGPLLFLLFAVGWRWLASDRVVGAVAALGALIKIQPIALVGWALLERRWRAVGLGLGLLVGLSVATVASVGPAAWPDFFALLGRVSDPVTTPGNVTIGALAYRAGASREAATVLQGLALGLVGVAWLVAVLRRPPFVGYLATVAVSQLASPILWDHYALLVLLPVAWLLERGRSWAALLPLAAPWPLVSWVPAIVYPGMLLVALAALLLDGAPATSAAQETPGFPGR